MKMTETAVNDFVPRKNYRRYHALHKMLLVVFFHHRALLSLPQLGYSTNTGLSRASFSCLSLGRHRVPTMACIKSIAHVNCFQSRLCILYDLCINKGKIFSLAKISSYICNIS